MIAVADTSPLNYLIQIDVIDLLPILFEQVLIPPAVLRELEHSQTPQIVCKWISHPPGSCPRQWPDISPGFATTGPG